MPGTGTSAATQLELPFAIDVMHTWTNAAGGLELTVTLTPTGARLLLVGPWPSDPDCPAPGSLSLPGDPMVRGVLWRGQVDLVHPGGTRLSPAPEGSFHLSRVVGFPTRLPVPDCFTAPLAWAAEAGLAAGLGETLDGLLMAMRRSLVLVARHFERVLARQSCRAARPTGVQRSLFEALAS